MTALAIAMGVVAFVIVCVQWANAIESTIENQPPRAYVRKLRRNRADLRRALGRQP